MKKKPPKGKRAPARNRGVAPSSKRTSSPVQQNSEGDASGARVAFTTSRQLEFFTDSELTTQIGYRKELRPLVLTKELIDNAIDACEVAGTGSIEIGVQLDKDAITVSDNGPGITGKIIKGVLDFSVRVSDKKHYIAPTRGQLGNALKCVVAAPFVATGDKSVVEIVARGQRHRIEIALDRIAGEPKITCTTTKESTENGTISKVHWHELGEITPKGFDRTSQVYKHKWAA